MSKSKTSNPIPKEITELGVHCAMHDTYTPQEQKYIFMMEVYDQPGIREIIRQGAHHGEIDLSRFKRTDCCRRMEIPFKALEPIKSHYGLMEEALRSISKKEVSLAYTIPDPKNGGKNKIEYFRVDYLFRYVRSFSKGQVKYAVIDIPFKVMQYVDTIDLGYHKIMPQLYLALHHQSTRRLYQLTETRIKLGYNHFKPEELFNFLSTKAQFRGIGNMCYSQIETAIQEMKQAYKLKMINYYLNYRVIYGSNVYVGSYASCIEFSLHFRQEDINEMAQEDQRLLAQRRFATKRALINDWKVEEWVADDISKKLTPADYDAVKQTFILAIARKSKGGMLNPAGYIVSLLKKALNRT